MLSDSYEYHLGKISVHARAWQEEELIPGVSSEEILKEKFTYKKLISVKPAKKRWQSTYRSAIEENYYHS